MSSTIYTENPNGAKPEFAGNPNRVASIVLRGEPYEKTLPNGEFVSCTDALEELSGNTGYAEVLANTIEARDNELAHLYEGGFYPLDAKVKNPAPLSYEDAYSLIAMVCLTSNEELRRQLAERIEGYNPDEVGDETLRLHSVSLLQGMSVRESMVGLNSEEIAGMIAATIELDTVVRTDANGEHVYAIGGMGGDKGLIINGQKSKFFSISTTGGLSLANFGLVHKHDSYPNTSKVAGQTAREAMGARSDLRTGHRFSGVLSESGFLGSSCHTTRTLHTISHKLRGETINHVIGPAAFPHSSSDPLHPLIGVNHNVHPVTYMQALLELNRRGVQQHASGIAFAGLDIPSDQINREVAMNLLNPETYYRRTDLKNRVILDEFAPPPFASMVAFLVDGQVIPSIVTPEDFMTSQDARRLSLDQLAIPNTTEDILAANEAVLMGTDKAKVMYIAMTVSMARFTKDLENNMGHYLSPNGMINRDVLRSYYYDTLNLLLTGVTDSIRMKYVTSSQQIR